jgi:DNA (cytosine-5)-methyltransferase 1
MVVPSGGTWNEDARPAREPHRTITSRDSYGVAELPFVAELRGGSSDARPVTDPASTFTAGGNHHALVTPYYGAATSSKPVDQPIGTLTTVDRYALIHRNNGGGPEMTTPVFEELRTLTTAGHQSLLQAGPAGGKPQVTPKDIEAAEKMLPDVLFRMFRPLEVAAGMAFPGDYDWDVRDQRGRLPSNRDLVKAMGNAVCPPCSRDIIAVVADTLRGAA